MGHVVNFDAVDLVHVITISNGDHKRQEPRFKQPFGKQLSGSFRPTDDIGMIKVREDADLQPAYPLRVVRNSRWMLFKFSSRAFKTAIH